LPGFQKLPELNLMLSGNICGDLKSGSAGNRGNPGNSGNSGSFGNLGNSGNSANARVLCPNT
jgi:hypothetical protein